MFLKSAMYIDLSHTETEQNDYEKLVRAICDKPLYKKPALGSTPSFLLDDSKPQVKTTNKFNEFKNAAIQQRPHANGAERQYLALLLASLPDFRVTDGTDAFDDAIVRSINDLKEYRDQFLEFIEIKCVYGGDNVDFEKVFEFFEELGAFFGPPAGVSTHNEYWSENYRFFAWELFLYLIAALKKNGRLSVLAMFLEESYHIRGNDRGQPRVERYEFFAQYCPGIDEHRNARLQLKKVCLTGAMLRDRADSALVSFEELLEIDFVLCLRHIIHEREEWSANWFPRSLVYVSRWSHHPFRMFTKAVSPRHQGLVCSLLGVASLKQLISLYDIAEAKGSFDGYRFNSSFGKVPFRGLVNYEGLRAVAAGETSK